MVSHDRYFLDKLCDHLFVFEGGGRIKDFNGRYYEWREEQKRIDAIRTSVSERGAEGRAQKGEGQDQAQLHGKARVGRIARPD